MAFSSSYDLDTTTIKTTGTTSYKGITFVTTDNRLVKQGFCSCGVFLGWFPANNAVGVKQCVACEAAQMQRIIEETERKRQLEEHPEWGEESP